MAPYARYMYLMHMAIRLITQAGIASFGVAMSLAPAYLWLAICWWDARCYKPAWKPIVTKRHCLSRSVYCIAYWPAMRWVAINEGGNPP